MPRLPIALTLAVVSLLAPAGALAAPAVVAHRGGAYVAGGPVEPEESLPAFARAARQGFTLEFDVKLTADRVPVVIHDDTLDRTTTCSGPVSGLTASRLRARCRLDVLGSPGSALPSRPLADPALPVPTLAEVLALARHAGVEISPEIKNLPTDVDFDPTPAYATTVAQALAASRISRGRIIVQSFLPANLEVARAVAPGVQTALLTLGAGNAGGPTAAAAAGDEWVSPQWPVDAAYLTGARAVGRRVVPYTLDRADEVAEAGRVGVDALITDDPTMAARVLGLEVPAPAQIVAVRGGRLRIDRRGRVRVRLGCDSALPCRGRLLLGPRGAAGRGAFRVTPGTTGRVRVRLSGRARALADRGAGYRVTAAATQGAALAGTARVTLTGRSTG